jgi:hypothetical protein
MEGIEVQIMNLTKNETGELSKIEKDIVALKDYLNQHDIKEEWISKDWHDFLKNVKTIIGHLYNKVSFTACLLAKEFLVKEHSGVDFDAAEKMQSAPGLDIDTRDSNNNRIIAEIKTTEPCKENDFGAQQKESIKKDLKKLKENEADHKYFFVTNKRSLQIINEKYSDLTEGITVKLL